jgi:hypothetical protein
VRKFLRTTSGVDAQHTCRCPELFSAGSASSVIWEAGEGID